MEPADLSLLRCLHVAGTILESLLDARRLEQIYRPVLPPSSPRGLHRLDAPILLPSLCADLHSFQAGGLFTLEDDSATLSRDGSNAAHEMKQHHNSFSGGC